MDNKHEIIYLIQGEEGEEILERTLLFKPGEQPVFYSYRHSNCTPLESLVKGLKSGRIGVWKDKGLEKFSELYFLSMKSQLSLGLLYLEGLS